MGSAIARNSGTAAGGTLIPTLLLPICWQSVVNLPKIFENIFSAIRGKDFTGATLASADFLNVLHG
jgi:hypothetical protein